MRELLSWDQPPAHTGLRALEPVFLLDLRVYWQNKKGIESLYRDLEPLIDKIEEEDLEGLINTLSGVVSTIDGYLKVRGTESTTLRRIRSQRCVINDAVECIKRGYAPGKLPSAQERLEMANRRLQEVGHG